MDELKLNQPKNTTVFPLAGTIPEYRQAKLAGKKYVGPIMNIAPFWSNVRSSELTQTSPVNHNVETQIPAAIPPKSVKLEMNSFSSEIDKLRQALSVKENELGQIRDETSVQNDKLSTLNNEKNAALSLIKNLKQELTNMQENNTDQNKVTQLQNQISQKEIESETLRQEIDELRSSIGEKDQLLGEISSYRKQIQEFTEEQKRLQQLVAQEEEKIRALTEKVGQTNANTPPTAGTTEAGQFRKFEKLLEEAGQPHPETPAPAPVSADQPKKIIPAKSIEIKDTATPNLTETSNAINGLVKDNSGRLVTEAIVIIKDKLNHNLRALKSNALGQFVAATPLPNGQYLIEVEKKGLFFDTVMVELTGQKLNAIEIVGHAITA